MPPSLLEVRNLRVWFPKNRGFFLRGRESWVKAVDDVSLTVEPGEVVGVVGESGSGKSTLARAIIGLAPIRQGSIHVDGREVTAEPYRPAIQMVFQDPYASLNPRHPIGDQIAEPLRVKMGLNDSETQARVKELADQVGLAGTALQKFPHEFSGGQRQRIAIARALALKPRLLLADEPVSALDVSIQAQILNLLAQLRRELGLSMVFISHDLHVVRHVSDRVLVMREGVVVEHGAVSEVLRAPRHEYTRTLMAAAPQLPV